MSQPIGAADLAENFDKYTGSSAKLNSVTRKRDSELLDNNKYYG